MNKKTNLKNRAISFLLRVVPACAMLAVIANANSAVSPWNGQPTPPENLKKYRKF